MNYRLILLNLIVFNIGLLAIFNAPKKPPKTDIVVEEKQEEKKPEPEISKLNFQIEKPIPSYLNYSEILAQLNVWQKDASEISEIGTYGKSTSGNDLTYFRIHAGVNKPVVLITASIHGNESWSTGIVMGYIGTLLDRYGDDENITMVLDNTDLYFVPVVCPDSYPDRRESDGTDPNRNFPTLDDPNMKSVQSIEKLRELFLTIKPKAAISGHTCGRVYLQPHGDTMKDPPDDADYKKIVKKMAELSQYDLMKACQVYRRPISGSEVDWYYRNGAFSIVVEYGTHQQPPTEQEIVSEFNRTFPAILYFIEEAPKLGK